MRFVLPSNQQQQARLAQSVARETLNLKVVGSSPTSGCSFCLESIAFALHVVEILVNEFLLVAVRVKVCALLARKVGQVRRATRKPRGNHEQMSFAPLFLF